MLNKQGGESPPYFFNLNTMKDPKAQKRLVLLNGGTIETEAGTAIIQVDSSGNPTVTADISGDAGSIGTAELADLAVTTAKLGADAVDGTKLADDAVSLEHLDAGITPSHIVFAAGRFTTAGGDTDETITVAGVLATDEVQVTLHTAGAVPVTVIDASASAGQIDVDMSADPSTDHVLTYSVLRAAA
jgi:hypothetical protein